MDKNQSPDELVCFDCKGKEFIIKQGEQGDPVAMPCKCREINSLERMIKSSGLSEEERNIKLEDFKPTKDTTEMFNLVKSYLRDFLKIMESEDFAKGIGLTGSVGSGKTHLLLAVANELLGKKVPVIFVNTPDLIAELKEAQFAREGEGLENKIFTLSSVKVLILDDVGKEKITDWVQTQYYRIINHRYIKKMPTLFTSNISFYELADKLGDATASRLYALTKERLIGVKADDYRLRRAK